MYKDTIMGWFSFQKMVIMVISTNVQRYSYVTYSHTHDLSSYNAWFEFFISLSLGLVFLKNGYKNSNHAL